MKKFLSMLLALTMLLSMMPMASVAAENETTWTKVASLADISTTDTFAITITVGGNTYVLPVVQAGNASGSTNIPEITGTVSGDTLTITNTDYSFGWNLAPTDGGYHIKSGNLYLYVAASNNGIRIYKKNPDSTFVWNVLACGLLGATEGSSYRTLCVDGTMASPQWSAYPTADKGTEGKANSKVRDNVLGLWKLNTASSHTCEDLDKDHKCDTCGTALTACGDINPKDHKCDLCGTALSSCTDSKPKDHKCDICDAPLSVCSDAASDGDHKCDVCDAEGVSEHTDDPTDGDHKCDECADYQFGHTDADSDKICDECKEALCGDDHLDTAGDGDHKCNRCGIDNVTVCQDRSGDGDHACDECGKENLTECADSDKDKDHNCDECGKENMNSCVDSDTDKDHSCDVCGKENITDCVDSATDKDHDCDVCGKKDLNDHTWDAATYEKPKTCSVCGKTEGSPLTKPEAPEGAYWEKVDSLSAIGADDLLAITITIDSKTYILPNGYVADKASAPRADQLGTVAAGGLYMTAAEGAQPSDYNWNVVAVNGGYQIKAGDNYLWMDANDVGLRITDTQSPSVWNVQSFGFLCASDPSGNMRTLCIRDGLWKSFKVSGGNAHSTVRNNKLGLWKYVSNGESGAPEQPEPAPEFPYWQKIDSLAEVNNSGQLAITVTEGGITYVLPINYVTDSKTKLGTGIHGTISDNGTYLTVDSAYGIGQYSWTVSAAGEGYQIHSGKHFLWVDVSDTGLRVCESSNPSVWNTLKCGLLGAADPTGTYRILCFRNGAWNSIKTTGGTATGTAHSSVRGNVLGLWKYVTGEEDPNAHICADAVGDKDHKCDTCGAAGASLCYDKPNDKDHDCDECGKRNIGKCSDKSTDGDHKCDECGKRNVSKCKDKDTDKDHRCDDCGAKDVTPHIWMKPTYKNPQICIYCGVPLGQKLTEAPEPEGSHWVKVESLEEIGPDDRFAITIMIDGVPYVLPNATVKSAKAAPDLSHKATISSDWEYITIGDGTNNASYNWSLEQAEGGYHIFAGDNYLWVTNSNSGIRISSTDTPTVWKVLHCKLLGGLDAEGDYRTICIRDDGWKSFKPAENSFWSKSHSTVRNNMLGLWKYVDLDPEVCDPCVDAADDGDHICDVCSKENISECVDGDMDHLCDDCSASLTECNDTAEDGDHCCDVCGRENFTDCGDANGDNACDDCGKALESAEEVVPEDTESSNSAWYIIPVLILLLALLIVIILKKKKSKE